ncbi:hypothetical protein NLJ89_g2017 [Agrocybe chaxingu]|uniref:Cytochrome P450 n=1 Tax=Agrocybe chaxingu TaxID=84603 RepID=A0A9W8K7D9_9AGAR|nr:hypothetical protein NLJ89_g2017 [Agrocybe chaxingu]
MPITHLLDWDYNIALISYGDEWRKHRKPCQQHLNRDAAKLFQPIQIQKTHEMLLGLLHSPDNFEAHSRVGVLSFISFPELGSQWKPCKHFPVLGRIPTWFPGAISQRTAMESAQWTAQMKRIPLDDIDLRMASANLPSPCLLHSDQGFRQAEGSVTPSLLTQFLEKKATTGASEEEEEIMKNVAYTVYGGEQDHPYSLTNDSDQMLSRHSAAASVTTISATGTFFYAMPISPDVQQKAQSEIDRVVGTNRLPDFTDRRSLPYIEAIYREVMRFCPPLPIGLMHTLAEDDVCGGYLIPKGTQVFPNIWAITHDPSTYKDPHTFQLERFLNGDSTLNDDDRVLAYGYGRSTSQAPPCVSSSIASTHASQKLFTSQMWITIVSVLACYNIGKAKDEYGNDIEINDEYVDSGLIQFKRPFKCSITPRSSLSWKLIEDALSDYATYATDWVPFGSQPHKPPVVELHSARNTCAEVENSQQRVSGTTGQTYLEWGRRYNSDIIHAQVLGHHLVVVNKREIADELLEKRARNSSGRPCLPIVKLLDWEFNIALMDYGDEWRKHRKVCQQYLNREASKSFEPIQLEKVHRALLELLRSPEDFEAHNRMLSISITMDMMYGYQVKNLDDPAIDAASRAAEIGDPLFVMSGSMINILPVLARVPAWVPGAISQKLATLTRYWTGQMKGIPVDDVKRRMDAGLASPSLLTQFMEKKATAGASEEEEEIMKNVAYTVYGAASDTTISATATFFYTMAISPEVQKKAQAEIDRVVGTHRLPDFIDRVSLPYIEAIYREVMRFAPPLPLGMMHTLAEDDFYGDYFLPKGTQVFANVWAITHDENTYKDPDLFKPERFFNEDGILNDDDRVLAYGICVGKHVASATMWITIVSILACFNISKAKDEFGKDIEIDPEFEDHGVKTIKKPFKCSITPRSPAVQKLIEEAVPVLE